MALGIIGLLAFLVCLGMVIVNKVRKKPIKYWLIVAPIALILFIVGVTASPAPTTALTASETSYMATVSDQSSRLSTAFTKLGELLTNSDFTSFDWKLSAASEITTIEGIYNEALALQPPSSMANIQNQYIQGVEHYNNAMILLTRGIDNLDSSLITQATTELYAGIEHINTATTLIEGFSKLSKSRHKTA